MPPIQGSLKLSSTLQQLQSGVLKVFTAKTPQVDPTKIVTMYSKGVLINEKLLNDDVQTGAAPNIQTTPQIQMVALTGLSLAPGEQMLLWSDEILGQVGVSNTGAAKAFKVAVSTVDPASGKVTASQTVAGSVAANADFAIAVASWSQLSSAPAMKQGALRGLLPSNFQMPTVQ